MSEQTWTNPETEKLYEFLKDPNQEDLAGALIDAPREQDADGYPLATGPVACQRVAEAMRKAAEVMGQNGIDFDQVAERMLADIAGGSKDRFWCWRSYIDFLLWERVQLHLEDALEYSDELSEQRYRKDNPLSRYTTVSTQAAYQ
jgi:hypothetical protein